MEKEMEDRAQIKKVRCFHRDCNEIVEVPLFADEMQYCPEHTKQLHEAYQAMVNRHNQIYRRADEKS